MTDNVMDRIRKAIVLFVTPVISLGAFWIVDFSDLPLISLPLYRRGHTGHRSTAEHAGFKSAPSQQAAEGFFLLLRKLCKRRDSRRAFMLCFLGEPALLLW